MAPGTSAASSLEKYLRPKEPAGSAASVATRSSDLTGPLPIPRAATDPRDGSILLEAHGLVHGARQADYSHPLDDFSATAALLNIVLAAKLKAPLVAEDIPMVMLQVKVSREIRHHKRDNLVDGAGYLETKAMVIDERNRRATEP